MYILRIRTPGFSRDTITLDEGSHRIGRHPDNDHCLDDATVSSHHCEILVSEGGVLVRDLQSTNGTFINGKPITEGSLQPGEILRLGSIDLELSPEVRISIPEMPAPKAAPPPLPDGSQPCLNHPTVAAAFECIQCSRFFCSECVHLIRRTGGDALTLCPACSGHCRPIAAPTIAPLRKRSIANWIGKLTVALTQRPPRRKARH